MQILINLTQIFHLTYSKHEKPIQTLKMKTGTCQTEFKSSQLKQKVKVGQRLKEKCVNNETIKKRKNDSKLKRKTPPQKISKKDSVPQEHATRMIQPSQQISNCSKETIDTTPIFRMNAVNEHHIIQSVKEVSEQQAENTLNVSATVVKKN